MNLFADRSIPSGVVVSTPFLKNMTCGLSTEIPPRKVGRYSLGGWPWSKDLCEDAQAQTPVILSPR
jgi:hypothetical protein